MSTQWEPKTDRLGVVAPDELAHRARHARAHGEKIVFTNGCFDLLHLGHVRYLWEARLLGNILFVGVNSDESARKLKPAGRPYNSETDRAGVVAALAAVSGVSIFGEDTATELVAKIRPNIYVKGGDYSAEPDSPAFPIEGEVVSRYGGDVRILPFAGGYSTTKLIERIRGER